jgi:FixJ family two-component response regulator
MPVMPVKPKIVVVDDDAGMNRALERLLKVAGFLPVTYSSGEALLESKDAAGAACLILDIHLPGLSGFDLHRRMLDGGIRVPVIFVTAYDDDSSRARARQAGAIAYFTKPFQRPHLLGAIARAMRSGAEQAET